MSDFIRYAIYHLPAPGPVASFGADWLGWDILAGRSVATMGPAHLTDVPRKYGFHATVKPPFALASDKSFAALDAAARDLAAVLAPVRLDRLVLTRIGRFLALAPAGETTGLNALAARVVAGLDAFRAPPSDSELARRRTAGLTASEDANLLRWGYPYVMEEFRFHMTLTGPVDDPGGAEALLAPMLADLPLAPYVLGEFSLVGERTDGMFQEIHRYTLSG